MNLYLNSVTRKQYLLFALTVTLIFFGWHGYYFNYGDQEEHLPQVYKMFNHDLYPHDYFMSQVEFSFSIRFYYKWTVYLLSHLIPVSLTCLLLNYLCIFITSYCVSRITAFFSEGFLSAFLAPFLLLVIFPDHALGDNSFQDNALICSTISITFCSAALLLYFRNKYVWMSLLAGLSAWFQVIESLIMISILCSMMLFHKKESIKIILISFLVWIIAASPMLIPMINIHLIENSSWNKTDYYEALYRVRNPNHYLPSTFHISQYIKFGLLLVTALVSSRFIFPSARKFVSTLTIIVITGMVVYYLLLEKFGIMIIGKTQWFKATVWLTAVYSITIAAALSRMILYYIHPSKIKKYITGFCLVIFITLPVLLFNSKYNPINKFRYNQYVGNYIKSDLTLMHEWIFTNTKVDAVFLISPDNFSFLCEAKRSMLIGYKAVIHEPYFMIPWADNFQRIYHFSHDTLTKQSPLMAAVHGFNTILYEPLKSEKLDYRLDDIQKCKINLPEENIIHRQGNFVLSKIARKN